MITLTRNDIILVVLLIVAGITAAHLNWVPFKFWMGGPKRLNKSGKRAEGAFVLHVIEQAGAGVSDASKLDLSSHSSSDEAAAAES